MITTDFMIGYSCLESAALNSRQLSDREMLCDISGISGRLCFIPDFEFSVCLIHFDFSLSLTLLHSERPKLYAILAFLSAIGLN